jgi:two-component system, LytTR family, response regulator AlgR
MTGRLRVIVVDDEPLAIDRLRALLAKIGGVEVIGAARTGQAAISLIEAQSPDICLLDIGMPGMDGIEVARAVRSLPHRPFIIFVTAFDRFAVTAFDVQAIDYLVKPVSKNRLEEALQRARDYAASSPPGGDEPQYLEDIWVPEQGGLTRIPVGSIERITGERDYVRLHVGVRSWLTKQSLASLEAALDPHIFVRLHRGAILRRSFIAGFSRDESGWTAKLADGSEQKVGRVYIDNARAITGRTGRVG